MTKRVFSYPVLEIGFIIVLINGKTIKGNSRKVILNYLEMHSYSKKQAMKSFKGIRERMLECNGVQGGSNRHGVIVIDKKQTEIGVRKTALHELFHFLLFWTGACADGSSSGNEELLAVVYSNIITDVLDFLSSE